MSIHQTISKNILKTIIFSFILFLPLILNAQIIITEIMYNPDGTDSGREWLEIYNSGSESVDINDYKLLENGTNHRLSAHNPSNVDNLIIDPGEYAVIADNSTKFLVDYAEKGLLIDSAFSLKNTGEEVSIVDSSGQTIDSFNYLPELGADGTGNSLQLNGSQWIPAETTPFGSNKTEPADETDTGGDSTGSDSSDSSSSSSSSNSSSDESTHSSTSELSKYKPKIDLKVSAGRERHTTINTEIDFELIHNQDSNNGISAVWSMGDGIQLRGRKIDHIYTSTGVYNIVLNTKNKEERAVSRTKVYVSEPTIKLDYSIWGKTVDVLLKNTSKKEINIGDYSLYIESKSDKQTNRQKFKIAPDTIVDSGQTLNLNTKITDFILDDSNNEINLYYPNGEKLTNIEIKENNRIYEILSPYLEDEKIAELEKILMN